MSTPPEQPHAYPERHTEEPAPKRPHRSPSRARSSGVGGLIVFGIVFTLIGVVVVVLLGIVFSSSAPTSPLSPGDVSATQEALTFATAQAHRQETREAANAQETVLAIASATGQAYAGATALAYSHA